MGALVFGSLERMAREGRCRLSAFMVVSPGRFLWWVGRLDMDNGTVCGC